MVCSCQQWFRVADMTFDSKVKVKNNKKMSNWRVTPTILDVGDS